MTQDTSTIATWCGRPVETLTRDELLRCVADCGREIQQLRHERTRLFKAADPINYLLAGNEKQPTITPS